MKYIVENMNEEFAKQICSWKYEGEYEIYNTVSFEEMKSKKISLLNPERINNYICFIDEENKEVVAYINIMKKENENIFLGIGLKPNLCGKGMGKEFLQVGIKKALERYPKHKIVLQVRSWNKRAINCYLNAGFRITKKEEMLDYTGNKVEFIFLEYMS